METEKGFNQNTYENLKVVQSYSQHKDLQPAEKVVLKKLNTFLKGKSVVDIGIGGGRTTHHLLGMCGNYLGLDISSEMVKSCERQYQSPSASFKTCDARDLSFIADQSIDFVLFSFNGIDCIPYEDRKLVFREIYRILKPGGYFCFSSHNVRNLESLYSLHFSKHPYRFLLQILRYFKIRKINGPQEKYKNLSWFSIRDGAEDFQTEVVYVSPEEQYEVLEKQGFKEIEIFSNQKQGKITLSEMKASKEAWIYFLSQK